MVIISLLILVALFFLPNAIGVVLLLFRWITQGADAVLHPAINPKDSLNPLKRNKKLLKILLPLYISLLVADTLWLLYGLGMILSSNLDLSARKIVFTLISMSIYIIALAIWYGFMFRNGLRRAEKVKADLGPRPPGGYENPEYLHWRRRLFDGTGQMPSHFFRNMGLQILLNFGFLVLAGVIAALVTRIYG